MIALDTNIFIYVLESNPDFAGPAATALHRAQEGGAASVLVYAELLSNSAFKDAGLRNIAVGFLDAQALQYVELTRDILVDAARLRTNSEKRLGLGDAIHLASALAAGADTFVTNDKELVKLRMAGLKVVTLADISS
ncbi:MAG TPA: PIN domain-containing protein [Candidatus Saccharimonadales bacterium]|jgi:predicted nucleic acid-binding protein